MDIVTAAPTSAEQPRLYGDLARLWPLLSPADDYVDEAATLRQVIGQHTSAQEGKSPFQPRLLELGAGGGHVLVHLQDRFECTATDLSESMLLQCGELVPKVRRIAADMRSLRLEEQFDVVLLLDAVDYMTCPEDLLAALQTAKRHLAPGGIVLVAPTYTRESFVDGEVADDATSTDDEDLTYFSYVHAPEPNATHYEMILLFLLRSHKTRQVEVIEDRHRCGLFSHEQWYKTLQQAGLSAELIEDDKAWTLFAATHA